ncbi:MAG: hypothetical protein IJW55_02380, partial [Clostridia bacterium]|nr:hypothetical protein [Clostridia bacterium]
TSFVSLLKVLVELFQKLAQWRARSPPRAPQSAKFLFRRFLFASFFFAPIWSKKKRLKDLYNLTFFAPFVYTLHCQRKIVGSIFILAPTAFDT